MSFQKKEEEKMHKYLYTSRVNSRVLHHCALVYMKGLRVNAIALLCSSHDGLSISDAKDILADYTNNHMKKDY